MTGEARAGNRRQSPAARSDETRINAGQTGPRPERGVRVGHARKSALRAPEGASNVETRKKGRWVGRKPGVAAIHPGKDEGGNCDDANAWNTEKEIGGRRKIGVGVTTGR